MDDFKSNNPLLSKNEKSILGVEPCSGILGTRRSDHFSGNTIMR